MTVNSLRLPFGQFALLASTELQQQGQKSVVNRTIYIRKLKLGVLLVNVRLRMLNVAMCFSL